MFPYLPVSSQETVRLLQAIQPIARKLIQNGLSYNLDWEEQALLRQVVDRIENADFSSPALRLLRERAGLSLEEMQVAWQWNARWYSRPTEVAVDTEANSNFS